MKTVHVIDSHTEGEPTRLVVDGGPELGHGTLAERRELLRARYDWFRSAVVNEPRGADHLVGALLCTPVDTSCAAGVIFFNNAGYLQMCGHGTIGLVATLAYLGRLKPGEHRIETPVGVVTAHLEGGHRVTVANLPAYRYRSGVLVQVPGYGPVRGDIAWGGNWFFLVSAHGQELTIGRWRELSRFTVAIMDALRAAGIAGQDGAEIDHVELFGPPSDTGADSRNFVMCPGGAYDRSPCGTGTSAKLACLYADGKLEPGQMWRQESILGTHFEASFQPVPNGPPGGVLPSITGSAYVTAEAVLLFDPDDPLRDGVRLG